MSRVIFAVALMLINMPAQSELNLTRSHPDEPVEHTYDERFSEESALNALAEVVAALRSFRALTEAAQDALPEETISGVGYTGWEIQNLGFENWPSSIQGAILKQSFMIKKLTYELVKERVAAGKLTPDHLDEAKISMRHAESAFQEFYNSFGIAD